MGEIIAEGLQVFQASKVELAAAIRAPALDPDIIAAEWSGWDKRDRRYNDQGRSERAQIV